MTPKAKTTSLIACAGMPPFAKIHQVLSLWLHLYLRLHAVLAIHVIAKPLIILVKILRIFNVLV